MTETRLREALRELLRWCDETGGVCLVQGEPSVEEIEAREALADADAEEPGVSCSCGDPDGPDHDAYCMGRRR